MGQVINIDIWIFVCYSISVLTCGIVCGLAIGSHKPKYQNNPSSKNEADISSLAKNLIIDLQEYGFEDGKISVPEYELDNIKRKYGDDITRKVLEYVVDKKLKNADIMSRVLYMLGNRRCFHDGADYFDIWDKIARNLDYFTDVELTAVQDELISCAEHFGSKRALAGLMKLKISEPWLDTYRNKTINYLKQRGI